MTHLNLIGLLVSLGAVQGVRPRSHCSPLVCLETDDLQHSQHPSQDSTPPAHKHKPILLLPEAVFFFLGGGFSLFSEFLRFIPSPTHYAPLSDGGLKGAFGDFQEIQKRQMLLSYLVVAAVSSISCTFTSIAILLDLF